MKWGISKLKSLLVLWRLFKDWYGFNREWRVGRLRSVVLALGLAMAEWQLLESGDDDE